MQTALPRLSQSPSPHPPCPERCRGLLLKGKRRSCAAVIHLPACTDGPSECDFPPSRVRSCSPGAQIYSGPGAFKHFPMMPTQGAGEGSRWEPAPGLRAAERGKMAAGGVRYFCTAGRGLEPFLAREVRERFGATEVRGQPVPVPNRGGPDRWGARPCSLRVSEPSGRGVGCAAACVETYGSGLGSASERVCKERLVPVHGICPSERPCPLASPAELRSALPSSSSSSSISLGGGCGGLREVLPETPSRSGFCVSPEVDCVSGKVFFSTGAEPGQLRKLKSGERLFLLLKKQPPLGVSGSKGKMLHEIKSLVMEEPKCWLDVLSFWRELNGSEGKKEDVSQESPLPLKRKSEEETNIAAKKQKTEQVRKTVSEECQVELGESCMVPEEKSDQDCCTESKTSLEDTSKSSEQEPIANEHPSFSFRVSCRCSGAIAKILTSQEIGRAIGIGLMKQFGWRADLRNPSLEIFVHLNDIHFVVGIPLFRLPLANREYISTAGLRSTVAWAMASLAEIRAGAFVLDPMCGLGTILLEAAKEWPEAYYWGADISNSQIEGADVNIRTAGLMDKIGLLKASVKALPLPSESFDAVISDIPFGKKFKITRDIQLLPDILQEMERVLRVGGTIVLLLSKDLHNRMDGITRCAENEPSNAISEGASETTSAKAFSIDGNSSSVVNGVEDSFFSSQQKHFGSLVPDGIYGVSLGRTDAFIHKYRKISTAVN